MGCTNLDFIERTIPQKANSRLQRYRLTVKGRSMKYEEAPYDLFVRWKPLRDQAIGWHPDFNDGVRFTVPLPEILPLTREQSRKGNGKDLSARSAVESGLESGLESLAARILSSLAESALSKAELAKALGHSSISSKLNQRVNQLLDLDFIERTIPQKPNSRLQKYRLTTRGRRMRNQSL